jgi:NTE family protein
MAQVLTREKEIQYSSRTRANSDRVRQVQQMRNTLAALLEKLPAELRTSPEFEVLREASVRKVYNLVHLIYRSQRYEGDSKDYEFSRLSMREHWKAGYNDTVRTLRHPSVLERPQNEEGFSTFDLARDGPG